MLMTANQHRASAAQLRGQGTPKALELAQHHEQLALIIERRQRWKAAKTARLETAVRAPSDPA